jgi:DNA-directed RNA polymerase subunit RPC12/RpoP
MSESAIVRLECLRCGHKWLPRKEGTPLTCPRCRSPYWNKPKGAIDSSSSKGGTNDTGEESQNIRRPAMIPIAMRPSDGGGTMSVQGKTRKHLALIAAVTLAAAGIWYLSRYSANPRKEKIQGAIGQRIVERDTQVNEADVGVTPGTAPVAVRALLESKGFRKVARDQAFQALMSNEAFKALMSNESFRALMSNESFKALMSNESFKALMSNESFKALMSNESFKALMSNESFKALMSNEAFKALMSNQAFQALMSNQAFQALMSNQAFQGLLSNQSFQSLLGNQAFQGLLSNQAFQSMMSMQNAMSYLSSAAQAGSGAE